MAAGDGRCLVSALPVAGDARRPCPNCGKLVGPKHAYRSGKTRCRNRYTWTPLRLLALEEGLARGRSDEEIARRLGTTATAVNLARKRRGLASRTARCGSARTVAARLGLGCAKKVAAWINAGWLRGRQGPARGANRQWIVEEADLRDFLRDSAHWHRWEVERIADPDLRAFADRVRAAVRFLTLGEVAGRMCVQPKTVHSWIAKGYLPAVRNGNHLVREDDLARFELPRIGGPRRRKGAS
jgi:hypothetical protein